MNCAQSYLLASLCFIISAAPLCAESAPTSQGNQLEHSMQRMKQKTNEALVAAKDAAVASYDVFKEYTHDTRLMHGLGIKTSKRMRHSR